MVSPRLLRIAPALCLTLQLGCSGKKAPSEGDVGAQQPPAPPPAAEGKTAKAVAPSAPKAAPGAVGRADLRDPPWFRPNVWPGASVTKSGRTEADAMGLFASQILLDLPKDATVEKCVETLREKVVPHVANLAVDPKAPGAPERVTLRGQTEHYRATIVCGKVPAKGDAPEVVKAFLSYEWHKLPEGATRPNNDGKPRTPKTLPPASTGK